MGKVKGELAVRVNFPDTFIEELDSSINRLAVCWILNSCAFLFQGNFGMYLTFPSHSLHL